MTEAFDLGRLKGRRLFVGTPMYDGKCHGEYAFSIVRLTALCTQLEIGLRFYFAGNNALITKARNETVDQFLQSGDDSLIFIDADIGFDPRDVIQLFAMQMLGERAADYDVLAAPYPLKQLDWAMILRAAKSGAADADPARLARTASAIAVGVPPGEAFALDAPVEVQQAGTGFMIVRRGTFERYRDRYPWQRYRPEEPGSAELFAFFDTGIDDRRANITEEIRAYLAGHPEATPEQMLAFVESDAASGAYSGHYLSEDYAFCHAVRKAGMKVWLCPWIALTHTGSVRFESRLADIGAIGPR